MSTPNPAPPSRPLIVVTGLLIALHLCLGIHTAFRKTVTHDEIWHLPVGILNWQTGRFDHDDLNPPLTRMWAALPGWLLGPEVAEGRDASDIATRYLDDHPDYRTWYICGRIMNLMFSLATILLLVKWSRDWFGEQAAVLTALLFCTEPTLLAHSSLVTPDAGLMLGFTATLYLTSRWRDQPTWQRAALLGLVLGLAQVTKFTAVLLYPVVGLACLSALFRRRSSDASLSRGTAQLLTALLISVVVWNAAFLFQGTGESLSSYSLQSEAMESVRQLLGPLANLPCPLPHDYLTGIDRQRYVMEQQHPVFLNGEWSLTGFPSYFLRSVQYKLSHPLQVIAGLGILVAVFRRHRRRSDLIVLLGVPVVLLTGIASMSSMQLGVRYILPLMPCLILFTGPLAQTAAGRSPRIQTAAAVMVAVLLLMPLRHHPHHLAYFNEMGGGPIGGRQHLLDSNLDWGQDLYLVREFMEAEGLEEIGLVYFGTVQPYALGIQYHVPPPRMAVRGHWYAVSVNFVMGRPHQVREPDGSYRTLNVNEFRVFQDLEPITTLGGSIDIYHIEEP